MSLDPVCKVLAELRATHESILRHAHVIQGLLVLDNLTNIPPRRPN